MSERSRWERCSILLYYLFVRTIRNVQQCPTCRRSIPYVPFAEPETALPATIGSATRVWVSAGRSRGQRPSGPPALVYALSITCTGIQQLTRRDRSPLQSPSTS